MPASVAQTLAQKSESGEPLHVRSGARHNLLRILRFNKERGMAFGVVIGRDGTLPMGTIVKLTMPEGRLQLRVVTKEQLRSAEMMRELALTVISQLAASLDAPPAGFDIRNARLFT